MFRRKYISFLWISSIVLAAAAVSFGQIANITGRVEVEKDTGKEAAAGALVEIYRTDISSGNKQDTTGKDGSFKFIGLPPGSSYLLTVSGEGLEPVIVSIRAGMENQVVTVRPGDGTRWTEAQVRGATTGGGELTDEQKAELAELEKRRAEYEAEKARVERSTAIITAVLKEGSDAFNDKNYDLAIVKFEEGYEASGDFVGSAPVLLNNKGKSLMMRAIDAFNASVTTTDMNQRTELRSKARDDFDAALGDFAKSWKIISTANPADINDKTIFEKSKADALEGGVKIIRYMLQTEMIAPMKAEEAKSIVTGFVGFEKDKAKVAEAHTFLGRYLLGSGDLDGSIAAYRAAMEKEPKNPDAVGGLGLALFSKSYEDEGLKQDALNYMDHYLKIAPSDHKFRSSIEGAVDDLKGQGLKPQKIAS